jgi:hypothetical protein
MEASLDDSALLIVSGDMNPGSLAMALDANCFANQGGQVLFHKGHKGAAGSGLHIWNRHGDMSAGNDPLCRQLLLNIMSKIEGARDVRRVRQELCVRHDEFCIRTYLYLVFVLQELSSWITIGLVADRLKILLTTY